MDLWDLAASVRIHVAHFNMHPSMSTSKETLNHQEAEWSGQWVSARLGPHPSPSTQRSHNVGWQTEHHGDRDQVIYKHNRWGSLSPKLI